MTLSLDISLSLSHTLTLFLLKSLSLTRTHTFLSLSSFVDSGIANVERDFSVFFRVPTRPHHHHRRRRHRHHQLCRRRQLCSRHLRRKNHFKSELLKVFGSRGNLSTVQR